MDLARLQRDPAAFCDALLIDADDGGKHIGPSLDSWQRDDFGAVDP